MPIRAKHKDGALDRSASSWARAVALAGIRAVLPAILQAAAVQAQSVLPQGGSMVSGQARINAAANGLSITQNSVRAIIDWNRFSVGANGSVNFIQPSASSAILNRVTGSTASTIAGQINANGQLFLVNPNGIAITPSGTVRVGGGFVGSTLDISNANFNAGTLGFAGNGASAAVSNAGSISTAAGGFVGLIGGMVSNAGTIRVPLGKVGLGSGERATLDPTGDGFLQVAVPTGAVAANGQALVDVSGRVKAAGGRIEITAATAQQAVRDAVNVSGALSARSVSGHNGSIVLGGGAGGDVVVSGKLSTAGGQRQSGGTIVATGNHVELTSSARLDASGTSGGDILVGGDLHGSLDPQAKLFQGAVANAQTTTVQLGAVMNANGTTGRGGNVVVWSDVATDFRGTITATGAGPGSGGAVEVSSHGVLGYDGSVDVTAASGQTGTLLLDPYDVTISTGANSNMPFVAPFTPTGTNSVLSVTTLEIAIAHANVTVDTGGAGSQNGDITVANAVSIPVGGGDLTLSAARDINVNASITTNGSGLTLSSGRDINVNAGITTNGGGVTLGLSGSPGRSVNVMGTTIDTGGGNLVANASATDATSGITLSNATINVAGGTATLTGNSTSGPGISVLGSSNSLSSTGSGTISLIGGSGTTTGIMLNTNASLGSSGNVTLQGASGNGSGVGFAGGNSLTASGSLGVTGSSTSGAGIEFAGATSITNNGTLTLNGTSGSNHAIQFDSNASLTTFGTIPILATSTGGSAVDFAGGNSLTASGGNLGVTGLSTSGAGIEFAGATSIINNATLTLTGTSGSGNGIQLDSNASLTTSGTMPISGSSTGGAGVFASGNDAVSISNGSLKIQGSTASGSQAGIDLSSIGNSITNNNSGVLTLDGTGGDKLAATIASSSGDVVISDTSAVNQSGGTITAAKLLLSGAGAFSLGQANMVGTLAAANVGAVSFNNNQSLAIGTVQTTTGVAATGDVTVTVAGDLTIAATAQIQGASPVLSATTGFINNAGSNAVVANSGRWLVYSSAPGSDTFGTLNSGQTAIWNATYASLSPSSVTASGDRYVFALRPTLTFTSTTPPSKTYGSDVTAAIVGDYTIAGYQSAPGAFVSDTAASVFTGAASVTSAGAVATADVAGSPYTMTVAPGSLSAISGYAFAFQNNGQLTVNPEPVSVTALSGAGASTYGSQPANPGLSANGLRNNETVAVLTGLSTSWNISNNSDAGIYPLSVLGTLTNPNYIVTGSTGGSWTVNPAPVSVTALGGSSTAGSSPANPGLSATGLQNGQTVAALTGLRNSFGITSSSGAGSYILGVAGALTNPNYTVASVSPGTWTVVQLRGSLNIKPSAPSKPSALTTPPLPIAGSVVAPSASNASLITLNAVGRRGAAPARPSAVAPAGTGNPGNKDNAMPAVNAPAHAANNPDNSSAGPASAPAPAADQAPANNFVPQRLNRGALLSALARQFNELTRTTSVAKGAFATLSLGLTTGILSWLLRHGSLLSTLLSSMPLWRGFDPLMILSQGKRQALDHQPPSEVDRIFDEVRARGLIARLRRKLRHLNAKPSGIQPGWRADPNPPAEA